MTSSDMKKASFNELVLLLMDLYRAASLSATSSGSLQRLFFQRDQHKAHSRVEIPAPLLAW